MAQSIDYIYQTCKDILQKDAHGYLTPSEFNRLVQKAQQEVFEDIYALYTRALQKRGNWLEYKDLIYNSVNQIADDLLPCYRGDVTLTQASANTFSYPSNYMYLLDVKYNGVKCEVYHTGDDSSYVINSSRVAPTTTYPIAVIGYNTVAIYPTSITSGVTMSYYKTPQGKNASGTPVSSYPTWAYDTVGGQAVYNATNSIQLELPESTYNKVISRVLQMAGVSIREFDVVQYAQNEEMEDLNQE